jgi:ferrous iron transport protein B
LEQTFNIVLVGNPNSGKSSLFNALTGLHQKVGNFPGVTVDKKSGRFELAPGHTINLVDLPGSYSLYPRREDEWVSYRVLLQQDSDILPDMILLVADASNLRRNLLYCSQIIDLGIPVVVALTMLDAAKQKGIKINTRGIEEELGVPVVEINPRKGKGINELKSVLLQNVNLPKSKNTHEFIYNQMLAPKAIEEMKAVFPNLNHYKAIQYLINYRHFNVEPLETQAIESIVSRNKFKATKTQAEEILQRYARIRHIMQQHVQEADPAFQSKRSEQIDNVVLHKYGGYLILFGVLFLLFQSVFWLAQIPMDFIEWGFGHLAALASDRLPAGWLSDLFVNGFLSGLSGILVFVPQIMILFGLITLLEDSGYMARISFLSDKLMRKAGLNGKSVMPMISGYACAVPAIMSARNIENKKERLLTMLVTPFMSCSARLPVYTILIGLVIPDRMFWGIISLQGLVLMCLYIGGSVMAISAAWILKWFIPSVERSYFILELPVYRSPRWSNMFYTMYEKARVFVMDAGKIIMIISLVLWGLSNYGPGDNMEKIKITYDAEMQKVSEARKQELIKERQNDLLQASYAGSIGKLLEPAIQPLGYDWKIGIALVTSFAAREVFVGTMATLYSVGDAEADPSTLRDKMSGAVNSRGEKVYTLASGLSLLIFYMLAMQCMSTLAVVKRETGGWKWPLVQLFMMTGLAYVLSLLTYQLLS